MGTIKGIHEVRSIEPNTLLFGDNEFETGVLAVAAGETATDGAVLTRGDDGKYKLASGTDGALFILVDRVEAPITEAGDYAVRVCISGRVNRNLVTLGGNALTDAQADALRNYNILALPVREA